MLSEMQSNNLYQVYNQSCIEGMREHVADNSIDLIFTDPPYGIDGDGLDVHYHRDESNVVPGYIDVPLSQYAKFSQDWINECQRVLRPGGSIYIVSGYTNLHHILNALHATDLEEVNHLIAKYSFGVNASKKWVSSHYHVLFWQKKAFSLISLSKTSKVFLSKQKPKKSTSRPTVHLLSIRPTIPQAIFLQKHPNLF